MFHTINECNNGQYGTCCNQVCNGQPALYWNLRNRNVFSIYEAHDKHHGRTKNHLPTHTKIGIGSYLVPCNHDATVTPCQHGYYCKHQSKNITLRMCMKSIFVKYKTDACN